MKHELLGWLFLTALMLGILLWPTKINQRQQAEVESSESGEDLYQTLESETTEANFALTGVRFYESKINKPHWNMRSESAELYQKENYTFLKKVNADFRAEKTGNNINTQSNFGRSYLDTDNVELDGDVKIRSQKGYLFELKKLNYEGKKQKFTSNELVTMKGPEVNNPSMTLRGVGLEGELEKEQFTLRSRVQATRRMKKQQLMKISSQSGDFFTHDQKAIFYGDVQSSMPGLSLQGQKMTLQIEQDKESLYAQGKVKLISRNRTGRADSAFIEINGNSIVLEGKAEIEDDQKNKVQGTRIILYGDDDRIVVENAEGKITP